jgi:cell division inhibitor SulA
MPEIPSPKRRGTTLWLTLLMPKKKLTKKWIVGNFHINEALNYVSNNSEILR